MIETEDEADPKTNDKVCSAENTAESHAAVLLTYDVIIGRKEKPVEGSYTNYLSKRPGQDSEKGRRESAEVIIAAKNRPKVKLPMKCQI